MAGLDRETGAVIDGWDHVWQSINVILATPRWSRVMRREFGSDLHELIGKPMTPPIILAVYTATAVALARWEPRFRLTGIEMLHGDGDGTLGLKLYGTYSGKDYNGVVIV